MENRKIMSKNRLEAFSDGVFAIILTILVLELKVPELRDSTFAVFLDGMKMLAPKFISFIFIFFIIAIFWVNHHHILHKVQKVDSLFLWLNVALLFSACLFPFITAFIGDYPANPYVVALYPLNMALSALILGKFWKYAFVDTDLAPNKFTGEEKKKRINQDKFAVIINLASAALAFLWVPITLAQIMIMPFMFVIPELSSGMKDEEE